MEESDSGDGTWIITGFVSSLTDRRFSDLFLDANGGDRADGRLTKPVLEPAPPVAVSVVAAAEVVVAVVAAVATAAAVVEVSAASVSAMVMVVAVAVVVLSESAMPSP